MSVNPIQVSVAILKEPLVGRGDFARGALLLNHVDGVVELMPELPRLFHIVERRGWHGMNDSRVAVIKLVEDESSWDATMEAFPEACLLPFGPADFVDTTAFVPSGRPVEYAGIQIACWSPRKRIELFIEATSLLPQHRFVHLGHFEHGGTSEELRYRDHCLELARRIAPNLEFPLAQSSSNDSIPRTKEAVNVWINRAAIGILTATSEGINRFKMECFSADRPMLVADDVCGPTRKHINEQTGMLFPPHAPSLADAIERTVHRLGHFRPRDYVLAHTGQPIALASLKAALRSVCQKSGDAYHFEDIVWDGRNRSMLWGHAAIEALREVIRRVGQLPPSAGH